MKKNKTKEKNNNFNIENYMKSYFNRLPDIKEHTTKDDVIVNNIYNHMKRNLDKPKNISKMSLLFNLNIYFKGLKDFFIYRPVLAYATSFSIILCLGISYFLYLSSTQTKVNILLLENQEVAIKEKIPTVSQDLALIDEIVESNLKIIDLGLVLNNDYRGIGQSKQNIQFIRNAEIIVKEEIQRFSMKVDSISGNTIFTSWLEGINSSEQSVKSRLLVTINESKSTMLINKQEIILKDSNSSSSITNLETILISIANNIEKRRFEIGN